MNDYRIPPAGAGFALGAVWMILLATIFGASVNQAPTTGDLIERVVLTLLFAAMAVLALRTALGLRRSEESNVGHPVGDRKDGLVPVPVRVKR